MNGICLDLLNHSSVRVPIVGSRKSKLHQKTITLSAFGYSFVFCILIFLRSEPWDYMSQGEQGKQHAWEPVGHSTLTDWKKYSGIHALLLLDLMISGN